MIRITTITVLRAINMALRSIHSTRMMAIYLITLMVMIIRKVIYKVILIAVI